MSLADAGNKLSIRPEVRSVLCSGVASLTELYVLMYHEIGNISTSWAYSGYIQVVNENSFSVSFTIQTPLTPPECGGINISTSIAAASTSSIVRSIPTGILLDGTDDDRRRGAK